MTTEERFERIEHFTAALAEERRKDREEYRQLWRETQRQLNEVGVKLGELTIKMAENADAIFAETIRAKDALRGETERAKEAEQELRDRITALVIAMGEFIQRFPRQ